MWLNSVSLGRFEVARWGGCGRCGDGWASLMKVQALDVCGNDGGGGDCEADGREATGSTGRGGHVTQERNSVSDYVLLQYFGEPERASDV